MNIEDVHSAFTSVQNHIISKLKKFDAKVFQSHDEWKRTEGGGGKSYAFANGSFLEKEALISPMLVVQTYPQQP